MKKRKQAKWTSFIMVLVFMGLTLVWSSGDSQRVLAEEAPSMITGFGPFDLVDHCLEADWYQRPDRATLISQMPQTLWVSLDESEGLTEIPVTWACLEEDYETTREFYISFRPVWDTGLYVLDPAVDFRDIPYVGVFFRTREGSGMDLFSGEFDLTAEGEEGPGTELMGPVSEEACGVNVAIDMDHLSEIRTCYQYFRKEAGMNLAMTCAILANIQTESNFVPTLNYKEPKNGKYYYGLIQWVDERLTGLKNYCSNHGLNYKTVKGQIHYVNYELSIKNPVYYKYNIMKDEVDNSALGSVYGSWLWSYWYEGCSTKYFQRRQDLARLFWDYLLPQEAGSKLAAVKKSGIKFPAEVGTRDSYSFSGKITSDKPIDRLKIGVAWYTDYAVSNTTTQDWRSDVKAERRIKTGKWVEEPSVILVKPGTKTYDLSAISKKLKFASLSPGYYTFSMVAFCEGYGYTLVEKRFHVKEGELYQPPADQAPSPGTVSLSNQKKAIKVSWKATQGADRYIVYKKTGTGSYKKLASLDASARTYLDHEVTALQSYTYGVAAANSRWTTKKATETISRVGWIKPVLKNTAEGLTVKWKGLKGARTYYVYRRAEGGLLGKIAEVKAGQPLEYTDEQVVLDNGARYDYAVSALYRSSKGYRQPVIGYRVTPVRLTGLTRPSPGSLSLKWTLNPHAQGYQIRYAVNKGFTKNVHNILTADGKTLTRTIKGLAKDKTWHVKIRAYIKNGNKKYYSPWSDVRKR